MAKRPDFLNDSKFKRSVFATATFKWILFFLLDVGSDLALAINYFHDEKIREGSCTALYIALGCLLQVCFALWSARRGEILWKKLWYLVPLAMLGMTPIYYYVVALHLRLNSSDKSGSKSALRFARSFRFWEIAGEAVPQFGFQLNLIIENNAFNFSQLFSLSTSLVGIARNLSPCLLALVAKGRSKAVIPNWILAPLIGLQMTTYIIPIRIASSTFPGIQFIWIGFYVGSILQWLCFNFRRFPLLVCLFFVMLHFFSFLVTNFVSSSWFVSFVPFLPANSTFSGVPEFVWPHPLIHLRGWVTNVSDLGVNDTLFLRGNCDAVDRVREYCLTDYITTLYLFFLYSSIVLFFYQCLLWGLYLGIFRDRALRKARERHFSLVQDTRLSKSPNKTEAEGSGIGAREDGPMITR